MRLRAVGRCGKPPDAYLDPVPTRASANPFSRGRSRPLRRALRGRPDRGRAGLSGVSSADGPWSLGEDAGQRLAASGEDGLAVETSGCARPADRAGARASPSGRRAFRSRATARGRAAGRRRSRWASRPPRAGHRPPRAHRDRAARRRPPRREASRTPGCRPAAPRPRGTHCSPRSPGCAAAAPSAPAPRPRPPRAHRCPARASTRSRARDRAARAPPEARSDR